MIVSYSMMVWIIIVGCLCHPVTEFDPWTGKPVQRATKLQAFLTIAYIIFFIGLRSAGADTHAYIYSFNRADTGGLQAALSILFDKENISKGPGFDALEILFKSYISQDYHAWLFFLAAVSGLAVAFTVRKNSSHFTESMLLFVLMGTYGWMINGVRQFVAVSLSFAAMGLITRRKWIHYIIVILLLSTIHKTALVMIPTYFIVTGKAWNKRTLLAVLGAVWAIAFVGTFTGLLDTALEGTGYEGMLEGYKEIDDGSSIIRTMIFSVAPVLAFVFRKDVEKRATPVSDILINMSIMAVAFSLIANFTSGITMGRLPIFFSIYSLILLPWLVRENCGKNSRYINIAMLVLYLILFQIENGGGFYYSDLLFGGRVIH